MINIILIDDQKLFIKLMADKLGQYAYYNVSGIFTNGDECLKFLKTHSVDLAMIDINMPMINGLELLEKIKSLHPKIKTIMISDNSNINVIKRAYALGADTYITKSSDEEDILEAIECVIKDKKYYGKISIEELIGKDTAEAKTVNYKFLSVRQNQIMNLLYNDTNQKEIAIELSLSINTVKKHIQHLYNNLNVNSILELKEKLDNEL